MQINVYRGQRRDAAFWVLVNSTRRNTVHRFLLTVVVATPILAIGSLVPNRTEASPLHAPLAVEGVNPIEKVATCFYADGWHGPGLYECGYRHRHGEGWYGRREERRDEERRYHRENRREDYRDRDRPTLTIPLPR